MMMMTRLRHLLAGLALAALGALGAMAENPADVTNLTPQRQLNGLVGYVNPINGQLMIKARFDDARDFHEGLAAVEVRGKWGYIDRKGNQKVKCQFGSATDFNRGYGVVTDRSTGRYGAVNTDGDLIVPCDYEKAEDLHHLLVMVIKE